MLPVAHSSAAAPRLILHVGTHKTGTTSIQKVLADNRELLGRQGLIYPDGGAIFGRVRSGHHRFSTSLSGIDPDGMNKARAFVANVRRSIDGRDTVLISAEQFYRHIQGHDWLHNYDRPDYWSLRRQYLQTVAGVLSDFDVEVLMVLREPESFARSLFHELRKTERWAGDFPTFLVHFAPWFEYDKQTELLKSVFASVRILSYEAACQAGLVATFFAAIGFQMPPGAETVWQRKTDYTQKME